MEGVLMWSGVHKMWISFNQSLEGRLPYMYLDIRNLVTTGMGNLIDPRQAAESLPWYDEQTGYYVYVDEIVSA